jgi:hypothetical protein
MHFPDLSIALHPGVIVGRFRGQVGIRFPQPREGNGLRIDGVVLLLPGLLHLRGGLSITIRIDDQKGREKNSGVFRPIQLKHLHDSTPSPWLQLQGYKTCSY